MDTPEKTYHGQHGQDVDPAITNLALCLRIVVVLVNDEAIVAKNDVVLVNDEAIVAKNDQTTVQLNLSKVAKFGIDLANAIACTELVFERAAVLVGGGRGGRGGGN